MFFFFNDTATTEIYTLSLHDALPILFGSAELLGAIGVPVLAGRGLTNVDATTNPLSAVVTAALDRKSTRLNSSHANISYAVFCLKKKNINLRAHDQPDGTQHAPYAVA